MATKDEQKVEALMAALDHPLKAEIKELRDILKSTNSKIAERVKWNAPSYYYQFDLAAFHLRQQKFVHLIMVFPPNTTINDSTGLLEADHKDRREAKFYNMADIEEKKPALQKIINAWVRLIDDTPAGQPYIFNS
ncbi:DUF1801 domain-containing protein [Mucilaginibacter myungsuensis]|uniref:DUF1801 domain-containing protein n=1 Tax=Mucilaginibacter myungsuensis TaxID=649104 RepID=A0A929PZ36_9SPHI|nr:DUF1801 domain-containing protein [Mucilaginibacter myungsuensis]MBE9663982.1 DUF1801 domain-containing protein [Mucilaginibacter myungsuensis]MDN3601161.1 DUF1801 domain-containing protein [Mucilaginibacter myungsuensis]